MLLSTKAVLGHVRSAHVLGQPRAGRLLVHKIVHALRRIADLQISVLEQHRSLLASLDQLVGGNLQQRFARLVGVAQIATDDSAADLADLGNRLAGIKVNDVVEFQRFVGLAPTQWVKSDHRQEF